MSLTPNIKIIDDVKLFMLSKYASIYVALHREQQLAENAPIPTDISYDESIHFMRISSRLCEYFFLLYQQINQ